MTKPSHYSSGQTSRKRQRAAVQQERWAKRRRHKSRDNPESSSSEDYRVEDVAVTKHGLFTFPTLDVGRWLGDSDESLLMRLPLSMFGVCRWCVDLLGQSMEAAKDTVFPSRVYQRELTATQEQLSALMKEVERLKEQRTTAESSSASKSDVTHCCQCNLHSASKTKETVQEGTSAAEEVSGVPAPSIPPPPPPPPPPPLPSMPTRKLRIVRKKREDSSKPKSPAKMVTLQDIQNVKLKKTSPLKARTKKPKQAVGGPLVSLSALKKIRLKKTSLPGGENLDPKMVLRNRIPQEAMQLRGQLKKVHLARSPGGTPVRGRIRDEGTGLTPVMARALRRKFQGMKTPSPHDSPISPLLRN